MDRMREVADDLVAKLMEEEEGPLRDDMSHHHLPHLGAHVRESEKWFYRDPQGQVQGTIFLAQSAISFFNSNGDPQILLLCNVLTNYDFISLTGPFSSEEMSEWFRLGYFNLNLLVRRAKDERFSQLQDLIKVFGGIPFLTEANVPPVKVISRGPFF